VAKKFPSQVHFSEQEPTQIKSFKEYLLEHEPQIRSFKEYLLEREALKPDHDRSDP